MEEPNASEANKSVVQEFYRLAFEERRPELASRLFDRGLRQHDPELADGRDAYLDATAEFVGTYPFLHVGIKAITGEGDLVVVQSHRVPEPGDRGQAVVETFRLEGGKIVERWNAAQDVPSSAANQKTRP